jgi:hypothetical protein
MARTPDLVNSTCNLNLGTVTLSFSTLSSLSITSVSLPAVSFLDFFFFLDSFSASFSR